MLFLGTVYRKLTTGRPCCRPWPTPWPTAWPIPWPTPWPCGILRTLSCRMQCSVLLASNLDSCKLSKRVYASVPYIKGISERLQRAFKSHKVTIVYKPVDSLRSQLVHVKDKTENLKKCGTVHHIHCDQCLKLELRNIFQGIHQPFTNIASSPGIRWIPAKQKFSPRKATRSNAA